MWETRKDEGEQADDKAADWEKQLEEEPGVKGSRETAEKQREQEMD